MTALRPILAVGEITTEGWMGGSGIRMGLSNWLTRAKYRYGFAVRMWGRGKCPAASIGRISALACVVANSGAYLRWERKLICRGLASARGAIRSMATEPSP